MTMNKKGCFFILLSLIPGVLFAQTNLTLGEKKGPVVVYTPFNFYGHLMGVPLSVVRSRIIIQ